jgi:mannose-6-phosphate isomerase
LAVYQLKVVSSDLQRPWGGFYVIDETLVQKFSDVFLNGLDVSTLKISGKLSPKLCWLNLIHAFHCNTIIEGQKFGKL